MPVYLHITLLFNAEYYKHSSVRFIESFIIFISRSLQLQLFKLLLADAVRDLEFRAGFAAAFPSFVNSGLNCLVVARRRFFRRKFFRDSKSGLYSANFFKYAVADDSGSAIRHRHRT